MRASCYHGDPLLDELELGRHAQPNTPQRRRFISLCVDATRCGMFPATGQTVSKVDNYGATWFTYDQPHACPGCHSDLRDTTHGPPFKREIAIYCRDRDRTVALRCPDCGAEWARR